MTYKQRRFIITYQDYIDGQPHTRVLGDQTRAVAYFSTEQEAYNAVHRFAERLPVQSWIFVNESLRGGVINESKRSCRYWFETFRAPKP